MINIPFFAGQEVGPPFFFDRKAIMADLKEKLVARAPLNFAITGQRRIGKTSLMKNLAEEIKKETFPIVIKCERLVPKNQLSFALLLEKEVQQRFAEASPAEKLKEVLIKIKKKISLKVGTSLGDGPDIWFKAGISEEKRINYVYDFTFELIERFQEYTGKKLVIFLDEFQELFDLGNEFLWLLRSYISDSKASFVVSSSYHRFAQILSDEERPFFNFFNILEVGPIGDEDCSDYVQSRLELFKIKINKVALEELLKICQGKPYYIQLIGSKLYDLCKRQGTNEITQKMYKQSLEEIMLSPPAQLISGFSHLRGKTKQVFIAFCLYEPKKSSELVIKMDMAPSAITQHLTQIYKIHGLLQPKGPFFEITDNILKEWVKRQFVRKQVTHFTSPTIDLNEIDEKLDKF